MLTRLLCPSDLCLSSQHANSLMLPLVSPAELALGVEGHVTCATGVRRIPLTGFGTACSPSLDNLAPSHSHLSDDPSDCLRQEMILMPLWGWAWFRSLPSPSAVHVQC